MKKQLFHSPWTRFRCAALFTVLLLWSAGVALATAEPLSPPASSKDARDGESIPPSDTKTETELPEVRVTDKRVTNTNIDKPRAKEGSAESGYRSTTAAVGALGNMKLEDTPYSISVTSSDFIENIQTGNATDALKYNPTVNPEMGSNRTGDYLAIRGFINSNNQALDGMRSDMNNGSVLEDKERIEVLSGANSFLYGIASPAGMVNYVLKRPTAERMLRVTAGDYGGEQAYAHVDAGGPIDAAGRFGYRINLLGVSNGDTGINNETHERYLLSGAFDWHILPGTLLSIDISRFHRELENMQAFFKLGSVTRVPDAPDPSKNYAAPYNGSENTNTTYGAKITSELNENITFRSAFRYSSYESNGFRSMRNIWTNNSGDYTQQMMYYNGLTDTATTQGYLFADLSFRTGFASHKVTAGYIIDYIDNSSTTPGTTTFKFPNTAIFNLANPGYSPNPNVQISGGSNYHVTERTTRQTALLADNITLNDKWSLILGGAYARVNDRNFDPDTFLLTSDYDKGAFTPSMALMFKPVPQVTTYASYIQGLEEGPTAPSDAANANEILKPFLSTQVEVGVKALIGGLGLNAAVFRIERANAYTNPTTNVYSEDGREVHIGGEFSFSGKLTEEFTLLGGFSIVKATIDKTSDPSLQGKTPQAVPESMARLYGEYAVPSVPGLTLTSGISYTGEEWVNDANTLSIPKVITGDIGMRYQRKIVGKNTILRFNVNNIADEHYWTTKGGSMLYLGSPRTFVMSATMEF